MNLNSATDAFKSYVVTYIGLPVYYWFISANKFQESNILENFCFSRSNDWRQSDDGHHRRIFDAIRHNLCE
jgi:DNA-binding GntR family transcriptional regulator